jgi:hypothetical protein
VYGAWKRSSNIQIESMILPSVRESRGWDVLFTTPPLERVPQRIALNTTVSMRAAGAAGSTGPILAAALGNEIKIWSCSNTAQVLGKGRQPCVSVFSW